MKQNASNDTALGQKVAAAEQLEVDDRAIRRLLYAIGNNAPRDDKFQADVIYLRDRYGIEPDGNMAAYSSKLGALAEQVSAAIRKSEQELSTPVYDYRQVRHYEDVQNALDMRAREQARQEEFARDTPVSASLASVMAKPLTVIDAPVNMLYGASGSDPYDLRSYRPQAVRGGGSVTDFVNTVRGTVSKEIEKNTNWELFGQNVWSFLYQTGMSAADSMANLALLGSGSIYAMGMSAAADRSAEILRNGGTQQQAFWGGLASGVAEAFFERFSVERLLKATDVYSIKSLVKEALKQAGTEASEEVFTEISNMLFDAVVMAESSDFKRSVYAYMESGMSEEQAKQQAVYDSMRRSHGRARAALSRALAWAARTLPWTTQPTRRATKAQGRGSTTHWGRTRPWR